MPVQAEDIKFYETIDGNNLGGAIDLGNEVDSGTLNGYFDAVSAAEALSGSNEYRCFYVRNESLDSDLTIPTAFVSLAPTAPNSVIQLGEGSSALNGVEQTIGQETDAPVGVVFQDAPDAVSGVALPDLTPNDYQAIWVKRTIGANTPSQASEQFSVSVAGETV